MANESHPEILAISEINRSLASNTTISWASKVVKIPIHAPKQYGGDEGNRVLNDATTHSNQAMVPLEVYLHQFIDQISRCFKTLGLLSTRKNDKRMRMSEFLKVDRRKHVPHAHLPKDILS